MISKTNQKGVIMKRIDERDTMFARMGYELGSKEYEDYYSANPDKKGIDDELRSKNGLCSPNSPTYDPMLTPAIDANFMFLSHIRHLAEGEPLCKKKDVDPQEITKIIKNLTQHYGAMDVGIAYADERFYYSHRGRHKENYGETVDTSLRNTIVYTVEMTKDAINTAPQASACVETSKAYVDAAIIGMQISYYIRNLGYNARCHMDGNYLVLATPLAVEAGLGEMGRNGLLVSRKNGCFVRIGVVTTDMPLVYDEKSDLNIQRFCRLCKLCIKTCPAKTISNSDDPDQWKIEQEKCYNTWRNIGTDCGICICACPIGQDISVEDIKGMSDDEIEAFVDGYRAKYGTRKRTRGKYFV